MTSPKQVTLIEVGPRDGLQNEPKFISTAKKIALIDRLSQTGLKRIEVTSFVSPKAIPQLADSEQVFSKIAQNEGVEYSALVPNIQGLERALKVGVGHISIFTAASESFNQRNIRCSIKESITRFEPVIVKAKQKNLKIRAYISCAIACPYEGVITPRQVIHVTNLLERLGVDEISYGDTIGVGTPKQVRALIKAVLHDYSIDKVAMHFHDTYGQAIANIHTSLEQGIYKFDTSIAGLGGCPYALGATGNVATEDVLYLLHGLGIQTGIDIYALVKIGQNICELLKKRNQSKVANALLAKLNDGQLS